MYALTYSVLNLQHELFLNSGFKASFLSYIFFKINSIAKIVEKCEISFQTNINFTSFVHYFVAYILEASWFQLQLVK